jgi:hypothetical protein
MGNYDITLNVFIISFIIPIFWISFINTTIIVFALLPVFKLSSNIRPAFRSTSAYFAGGQFVAHKRCEVGNTFI